VEYIENQFIRKTLFICLYPIVLISFIYTLFIIFLAHIKGFIDIMVHDYIYVFNKLIKETKHNWIGRK
jgi:hypothetical protein